MASAAIVETQAATAQAAETGRAPGFGVYVHWPFCASKCPYCDFNSHVRDAIDQDRWRRALLAELDHLAARSDRALVTSVFFGGGTPSLMAASTVAALIDRVARHFPTADDMEITLEANPTSVEADGLSAMRAAGVNRVSLGVQSLNDAALEFLGRSHSAAEALKAHDTARTLFERVSVDLIYARPGQTAAQWQDELTRVLALEPTHVSLYQLTVEPGTVFGRMARAGRFPETDEEIAARQFALTRELCRTAGLAPYEVSNFAAAGEECRHNLTYWRYGPYLGVGPGAHGRILRAGDRLATLTERQPERWLARVEEEGNGLLAEAAVTASEQGLEYVLMAMRLAEGLDPGRYALLAGEPLDAGRIDVLIADGLIEWRQGSLAATDKGVLLLNSVINRLI